MVKFKHSIGVEFTYLYDKENCPIRIPTNYNYMGYTGGPGGARNYPLDRRASYEKLWVRTLEDFRENYRRLAPRYRGPILHIILNELDIFPKDATVFIHWNPRAGKDEKASTMEFRCFDAKRDWKAVIDHVQFLDNYVSYIHKQSKRGIKVVSTVKDKDAVKNFPKNRAIKEFNMLLKVLKLNPLRYKRYLNNLHDRYEYHKDGVRVLR